MRRYVLSRLARRPSCRIDAPPGRPTDPETLTKCRAGIHQGRAMITCRSLAALTVVGLMVACSPTSDQVVVQIQADRFAGSEWSDPVNVGPVINTSALDANASLSSDAHEMFFVSTRVGGFGLQDIWMSRRQCLSCPWEAPVNLG